MTATVSQDQFRILVVDDNQAIHSDFKKILCPATGNYATLDAAEAAIFDLPQQTTTGTGFQVDSAFQGQEGLELVERSLAARQPYAVVFMDVRMPPGWDGVETTARIWKVAPDTQIVICTAYSDYSWDDMINRLGKSDRLVILKKPFDNVEVMQLAYALAEKWQLGLEARLKMEQMEAMVALRTAELRTANEKLKIQMDERARTEEALRQSQKMQALGQLAGGIAHDFNNLLTVIRGYVDCLLAEPQHDPETLTALQEIDQATDRATKLTTQILMFSRKKRMQPLELNLNEVVNRLGNMLRRLLGENITMQIVCNPRPTPICADPAMMEQILLNLVMNARDAMPDGGKVVVQVAEVELDDAYVQNNSKARPGKFARVSVTDTGTGIPAEVMPHLFDPFFTTKELGKGTGLGLSTVYGVVEQHKGWVEAANNPDHGANFTIYLPISMLNLKAPNQVEPRQKIPGGKETILLVEDDPVIHRLTRNFLQRHGYHVYEANTGEQALGVWREHANEIDLLLTDMVMPGDVSGRQLAVRLLSEEPSLKVIYTTGYSVDAMDSDHPMEEGLNFLAKPYSPEKLAQTIRRSLDSETAPTSPPST